MHSYTNYLDSCNYCAAQTSGVPLALAEGPARPLPAPSRPAPFPSFRFPGTRWHRFHNSTGRPGMFTLIVKLYKHFRSKQITRKKITKMNDHTNNKNIIWPAINICARNHYSCHSKEHFTARAVFILAQQKLLRWKYTYSNYDTYCWHIHTCFVLRMLRAFSATAKLCTTTV